MTLAATTSAEVWVWVALGFGFVLGILAAYGVFLAGLLIVALTAPRQLLHRHAARELNQALGDYFRGGRPEEAAALLVRLRAAATSHYDALVELDQHDTHPRETTPAPATSPVDA